MTPINKWNIVVATIIALLLLAALLVFRPKLSTVKVAWDRPEVSPTGYIIRVDDQVVQTIEPPPPVDPSCQCYIVPLQVTKGSHKISVRAFGRDKDGVVLESPPAEVAK
jgi:hypothetical protein